MGTQLGVPVILGLMIAACAADAQTLTAEDYAEIRNLAQYYNLGYDSSVLVDGGAVLSRAFTSDMSFTTDSGLKITSAKALAEYAVSKAAAATHHWDSNFIIQPHPDGAQLFRYTLVLHVDASGAPVGLRTAGPLSEVLVKRPEGWFVKARHSYNEGRLKPADFPRFDGRPIAPAQSGKATPGRTPLSALDHIEIEMLYGWNNIALDSVAEKGEMFARTFTPDGSLQIDGRTVAGRANLAAFAASGAPAMRRWLSNLYIEPSADGAIGWAYVVTIDGLGVPSGEPVRPALQTGGLYRDVIVKTKDGWRFKSRTFTPGHGVTASGPLPGLR